VVAPTAPLVMVHVIKASSTEESAIKRAACCTGKEQTVEHWVADPVLVENDSKPLSVSFAGWPSYPQESPTHL
jgi:hypothetical protein